MTAQTLTSFLIFFALAAVLFFIIVEESLYVWSVAHRRKIGT